ncbi:hypothetical protein AB833_12305 [Chromatiales bacterium (ex Bugula neritina AB1)]|nr:hypothetical protein AB833_12305 [Chromatiales bacterium (ex Bugula neritina AB1)]
MSEGAISRYISELEAQGGLRGADIANLTDVSKATVSRWANGKAYPQPKNELRLSSLYYIVSRLQEYYDSSEIRVWLNSPHPQLDGERAIVLIHKGRSEEVLQVIKRLDSEAYL